MGVKKRNYRLAWIFTYYLKSSIIIVLMSLSFIIIKQISIAEILILILAFCLFIIASIH